jgi:hypothetical protein
VIRCSLFFFDLTLHRHIIHQFSNAEKCCNSELGLRLEDRN